MNIYLLDNSSLPSSQIALRNFEEQFHYPLGENHTFTISHGLDYSAFYRSMGDSYCLVAEEKNQIVGTFCCALRKMHVVKNKTSKTIVYLGDLKISKHKQNTMVYYRLAKKMFKLIHEKIDIAIAIVMDGTSKTPEQYTGKAGLPKFHPIHKYFILRINTSVNLGQSSTSIVSNEEGQELYLSINNKNYLNFSADNLRTSLKPVWLVTKNKDACGKIVNTEKVKRLFLNNGEELRSLHLSNFSFVDQQSGYSLLLSALNIAREKNFSNLFVALSERDYTYLLPHLNFLNYEVARATLYSNQIYSDFELQLNTAEI